MSSVDGLVSGLDTSTIIRQLMQIERLPQTMLSQRKTKEQRVADALGTVRTNVLAVRDLARDLRSPTLWQGLKASASNDAVSVSSRTGSVTGSLRVSVTRTATAAAIYSDPIASLDTVIAPAGSVFAYRGGTPLGFDSITGNGIPIGDLPIIVTAPTTPAVIIGEAAPTTPVTIDAGGGRIDLALHGTAHSLAVPAGTYATAGELRSAVATAISAHPDLKGKVDVSLDAEDRLQLATFREGSAASLAVTGGEALAALGLSPTGTVHGGDGTVEVGADRVPTAITDSTPGTTFTLPSSTGSLEVTLAGPLRAGTMTAAQQPFGAGTLRDVVDTINRSGNLGYTATAINVGDGYRLQLTAKETGAASTVDLDRSMFAGVGFHALSSGRDAVLTVLGDTPYDIASASGTFRDLLPGVDVTATRISTEPVTITVERNQQQVADKVAELVTALNTALKGIKSATAYDAASRTSGVLSGNSPVRRVAQDLTRALTDAVAAGGALASAGQAGISLARDGTISFDRDAFVRQLDQDPAAVAGLFAQANGGSAPGVVDRLVSVADQATAFGTGYLTSARDAATERITGYTRQIDAYEVRMEQREATLRRTYAGLETALSGLSSQQSWLAGQLASLSAN